MFRGALWCWRSGGELVLCSRRVPLAPDPRCPGSRPRPLERSIGGGLLWGLSPAPLGFYRARVAMGTQPRSPGFYRGRVARRMELLYPLGCSIGEGLL